MIGSQPCGPLGRAAGQGIEHSLEAPEVFEELATWASSLHRASIVVAWLVFNRGGFNKELNSMLGFDFGAGPAVHRGKGSKNPSLLPFRLGELSSLRDALTAVDLECACNDTCVEIYGSSAMVFNALRCLNALSGDRWEMADGSWRSIWHFIWRSIWQSIWQSI